MNATEACREMFPHEKAADQWARAQTRLQETTRALEQARREHEDAVGLEREAWEKLASEAGRALPPSPSPLPQQMPDRRR